MANFVINTFTVKGPEELIQKMLDEAVRDEQGRLMYTSWWHLPSDPSKEYVRTDEYVRDFCLKNFGCKWDCEVEIENRKEGQVEMCVQSPWVEPEGFFVLLSERYAPLIIRNYALYVDEHRYTITEYDEGERELIEEGEDED